MSNSKKGKKKQKSSFLFKVIMSTFTIMLILIFTVYAVLILFHSYINIAYDSYRVGIDTSRIDYLSVPVMYDNEGNQIKMYYGYHQEEKEGYVPTYTSVYTKLGELPKHVYNAFIAIEDETFFENYGFSPKRLIAAVISYKLKGNTSFGASTITQQLIKISTGDNEKTPERKAREIGEAIYLTEHWSKFKILESYINIAYYGYNSYGIYEASMNYFGKIPQNLNIAESATLAAILNKPDKYCPYNGLDAINSLMKRQKLVLKKMYELLLITEEEYNDALNYNVTFIGKGFKYKDYITEQYASVAFKEALKIVMDYYYLSSTDEALKMILEGNTKIYTNLDSDLQHNLYKILNLEYGDDDIEAGFVITTKGGKVIASISSRKESNIDHVYTMTRQTGSSIKPLSVYGPAFDLELISPSSYEIDGPVTIDKWTVHNSGGKYRGAVTIKNSIAYSYNTIAVKTLQKVGLKKSVEYLRNLGITSISDNDMYYPALALGGLSKGISPFEMCQAYNTINNDGNFYAISYIDKIEINGTIITPNTNYHNVFSKEANDMLKECLSAVVEYGTAKDAKFEDINLYAKTGTTSNKTDFWTCGFTDDITASLWIGYDTPKEITIIKSSSVLSKLFKDLLNIYYKK